MRISSRFLVLAVLFALGACSSGPEEADVPEAAAAPSDTESASAAQDVWALEPFTDLEPGTYFIDPDGDPSTRSVSCTRSPPRAGRVGSALPNPPRRELLVRLVAAQACPHTSV